MSSAGVEGDAPGRSSPPASADRATPPGSPVSAEVISPDVLIREVAASHQQVTIVRHALAAWIRTPGLPAATAQDVLLAATAAMANVVDHAYPHDPDGTLILTATSEPEHLTVAVTDTGQWNDTPSRPGRGRGIAIMRAMASETAIITSSTGTTVRLTWPRTTPR